MLMVGGRAPLVSLAGTLETKGVILGLGCVQVFFVKGEGQVD
jgi:hypothetical protein